MTNLECALKGLEEASSAIFSHLDAEALDDLNFAKGAKDEDLPLPNPPEWSARVLEALDGLRSAVEGAARALDERA